MRRPSLVAAALAIALSSACSKDPPAPATQPPAAAPRPGAAAPAAAAPAAPAAKGSPAVLDLEGLVLDVPAAWQGQPVRSSMRRAHYVLPAAAGETRKTELVVYHFGAGGAGGVEANLERWYGQFQQPDGKPSREVAVVEQLDAGGVQITLVDVAGRYVAAMMPGAAEQHDEPGFRMLAAIFDGGAGAFYLKLVGPASSVELARPDFVAMLRGLRRR